VMLPPRLLSQCGSGVAADALPGKAEPAPPVATVVSAPVTASPGGVDETVLFWVVVAVIVAIAPVTIFAAKQRAWI